LDAGALPIGESHDVDSSGTIDLDQPIVSGSSSMTGDSLLALFNSGNAYTNVHTVPFPAGEIRGQIIKQ
jgi:hypothetical protein